MEDYDLIHGKKPSALPLGDDSPSLSSTTRSLFQVPLLSSSPSLDPLSLSTSQNVL